MIQLMIESILNLLQKTRFSNWFIVMILSFLPIVESRLGLPIALRLGMSPASGWFFSFLGSSLAAPFVLLLFAPVVAKIQKSMHQKKTGFFDKIFSKHAKEISDKLEQNRDTTNDKQKQEKTDRKKMLAVITFVAIPGPMTGVWGASVVSSILKLSYVKSIVSVTIGNLLASLLVLLFAELFYNIIDYIILAVIIMFILSAISLVIKFVVARKKEKLSTEIAPIAIV